MSELPPLPEAIAGHFVGVHAGRLVVAGGTYWTRPKWEGGEKRWTQAIYTLGEGETGWRKGGEQPEPLAYGGAVSTASGVICIAGQGPADASASVRLLSWDGARVAQRALADLPEPRMSLAAAAVGDSMFAAAGQDSPQGTAASAKVWKLEPAKGNWERARWQEVPPIPGPGRILPAMAGFGDRIYVAGGAALLENGSGTVKRAYLRDAYEFRLGGGWVRLPELPSPAVAAPACCDARGRFLIFGGDDGAHVDDDPGPHHPGFSRTIIRFEEGNWRAVGALPEGQVTCGVVLWRGSMVVPGGENRPGTRTTRVVAVQGLTQ